MKQLTKDRIHFSCGTEHLYAGVYVDGNIAIFAGKRGEIGKLSVNLPDKIGYLAENEFFVKLYGTGESMNDSCFATGLFEKVGEPFKQDYGTFQKWRLID